MNPWRWRIGLTYLVIGVLLAGAITLMYGNMKKMEQMPTGSEVIARGVQEKEESRNLNTDSPASGNVPNTESKITPNIEAKVDDQGQETQNTEGLERSDPSVRAQSNTAKILLGMKDFPSPVKGHALREVGNYYSEPMQAYLFHAGTDYAEPEGAIIRVTRGGKVIYAGPDPLLGQKAVLDCGDDWSVVYGGLDNLRVHEGDIIGENLVLGQIGFFPGADGVSDQPQLHYEVWHGDDVQIPEKS